jgi:hypothetical protein
MTTKRPMDTSPWSHIGSERQERNPIGYSGSLYDLRPDQADSARRWANAIAIGIVALLCIALFAHLVALA